MITLLVLLVANASGSDWLDQLYWSDIAERLASEAEKAKPPKHRYEIQTFQNSDGTWTARQVYCYDPRAQCHDIWLDEQRKSGRNMPKRGPKK